MDFEEEEEDCGGLGLIKAVAEFRSDEARKKSEHWPEWFQKRQLKEASRILRWRQFIYLSKQSKSNKIKIFACPYFIETSYERPGRRIVMFWSLDGRADFDYDVYGG